MHVDGKPPQHSINDIRCPAIKGLRRDVVILLHKTMVGMTMMHLSIETAYIHIDRSRRAALESRELLTRLRIQGF